MPPYRDPTISIGTWVEMTDDVPMRYEVSDADDNVALYFGACDDCVLVISRDNLAQMLAMASRALMELKSPVVR